MKKLYFCFVLPIFFIACGTSDKASPLTVQLEQKAAEAYKICEVCHGEYAQLHALGHSDVIASWSYIDIRSALLEYKSGTRNRTGYGSIMQNQLDFIDNQEIELLSKYIPTLYTKNKE